MTTPLPSPVQYKETVSYTGNRPIADVRVNGSAMTLQCLVDTGADRMILPSSLAPVVGLQAQYAQAQSANAVINVTTASGHIVPMFLVTGVSIEIEGHPVNNVEILFDSSNHSPYILGRQAFLRRPSESGFNNIEWLFNI